MRATLPALLHDPVAGAVRRIGVAWEPGLGGALRLLGDGLDRAVPAGALSLSRGGWRGEAVTLAWTEEGRAWAVTVDRPEAVSALLGALPPRFADTVAGLRRELRRGRRRRTVVLAVVIGLVLLPLGLGLSLYLMRDRILDAVVRRLPWSVDARLGELAHRQVAATGRTLAAGPAVDAVQAIGSRLLAGAPSPPVTFRFEVLRDRAVNAFAAPGGLVVVHTQLIAEAQSADELAGILAHEITHVLERHSLRQLLLEAGLLASARLVLGLPDGVADALAGTAVRLGSLTFSRDQEREADRGAVELLVRARLPATGLPRFFERLARRDGPLPALLSTHPPSTQRAAQLGALIEARGRWPIEPLPLDWEAVRRDAAQGAQLGGGLRPPAAASPREGGAGRARAGSGTPDA